ncbi:UV-damage endonuclease [Pseudomonas duriflava]|uniref:UV-damage endonuclease n=1 Tax=Pseudomonas duriflava TaxID=459528 RepID=A0A562QDY1_9PSED|nr:UV DNA damage repair endonuclease UvsE [Pseudomonas duriflava]TWI54962.1 UV-damage endonuclease [Pseudomonas duriflava]
MYRIGFACSYRHPDRSLPAKEIETIERLYNGKTTTLRWMSGVTTEAAEEKLLYVIEHNLQAQMRLLSYVNSLPSHLKMMRMSSDILPFYSHPSYTYFYDSTTIRRFITEQFEAIGEYARAHDIRLSMHPGQYCVLASDNPDIVENSIREFEYHADMIRMMGYGRRFQDFKCNIHISGRLGVEGIRHIWPRLSEVAKQCITFENEEKKHGVDACLELADLAPVVLDIHHCWIHEGRYIERDDPRVQRIIESWRGVRPTMHYSQSLEMLMDMGFSANEKLDMETLLTKVNKRDLYAHSDRMWNRWCNQYAMSFLDRFDIMFEAKHKNLAVIDFYNDYLAQKAA